MSLDNEIFMLLYRHLTPISLGQIIHESLLRNKLFPIFSTQNNFFLVFKSEIENRGSFSSKKRIDVTEVATYFGG